MEEIIPILVELVFAIVTVVIVPNLIKFMRSRLDEQQIENLKIIVENAVHAFEQTITEIHGGEIRKEEVVKFVTEYCEKKGINVDEKLLDILIESVVYQMNKEKKALAANQTKTTKGK